jgi:hypothetical protein
MDNLHSGLGFSFTECLSTMYLTLLVRTVAPASSYRYSFKIRVVWLLPLGVNSGVKF